MFAMLLTASIVHRGRELRTGGFAADGTRSVFRIVPVQAAKTVPSGWTAPSAIAKKVKRRQPGVRVPGKERAHLFRVFPSNVRIEDRDVGFFSRKTETSVSSAVSLDS